MTAPVRATATSGMGAIVRGEFEEMQGLRLTLAQVCRLWTLTRSEAEAIVGALVERGLLAIDDDERICRPQDLSD